MKANTRIIGAVLVGVSTWLLASYFQNLKRHHHRRVNKQLAKEAHQSWEGEGGSIIDAVPRATAG